MWNRYFKGRKSCEIFFATFKQKFRRMKCRGNLKLQIAERKEKNPFKNAQNPHWTTPSQFIATIPKKCPNVNKVKGGKCKKGPFSYFKWIYFYLLVKNEKKKSFFQKKGMLRKLNVAISQKTNRRGKWSHESSEISLATINYRLFLPLKYLESLIHV